ncbi:MAG: hypothetical protein L3J70_05195 [Gammaproteobacteria bacterium]|nr:hypothetical protein [Gammaproteobacteria bacterium]
MSLTDKLHSLPLLWVCALLLITQSVDASSSCSSPILRGFTVLQDSQTALNSPQFCQSLQKLQQTGANSVVFVPFMKQESVQTTSLFLAENVSDEQLIAGIREAKRQKLHVVVKPQLLVNGSWAGRIKLKTNSDEQAWFKRYIEHLIHYAKIAETNKADAFVIGTEMKRLRKSQYWPDAIQTVRRHFSRHITYAAHGIDGVAEFPYWNLLDSIGVTLYPAFPKKASAGEVRAVIDQHIDELGETIKKQGGKAAWILEIGTPSAEGWEQYPWDWRKLRDEKPRANSQMQAAIMKEWLESVDRSWIEGVWVWKWRSSPQAGGEDDSGYTVQNKPTQLIIKAAWQCSALIPNQEPNLCKN